MFILRTDTVAVDLDPHFYAEFLKLCDHFGITPLHAIAPVGRVQGLEKIWDNTQLKLSGGNEPIQDNPELLGQLLARRDRDLYGVHWLFYIHRPTTEDIARGKDLIEKLGLPVTHFVPPFNAGEYASEVCGLKLMQRVPEIDRFRDITPEDDDSIKYLLAHGVASVTPWRYQRGKVPGALGTQTLDSLKHVFGVLFR